MIWAEPPFLQMARCHGAGNAKRPIHLATRNTVRPVADITRATQESNPGWKIQLATLAKTERAAYWQGELTNAHIPDVLDATWRGDPEVASPFY